MQVIERHPLLETTSGICDQEIEKFLAQQRTAESQEYSPRLDLCKLLDVELGLANGPDHTFLQGVVHAAHERLSFPRRVNSHGVYMNILRRVHDFHSGDKQADVVRLFIGNDDNVGISTSFGGRNASTLTHLTAHEEGMVVRREVRFGKEATVALLGDTATSSSYSYHEYVDAVSLDLFGLIGSATIGDHDNPMLITDKTYV